MKIIKQDIFEGQWDVLIHCCNLYHIWGAGIVVPIKRKFPEAFDADLKTSKGDLNKLGEYSLAYSGGRRIANLYAQIGIGNRGHPLDRNFRYDYFYDALFKLCEDLPKEPNKKLVVAVPDMVGCGLAGGDRQIVTTILDRIEHRFSEKVEFHVFQKLL
jgi:O-acetyl-ADP-ribose deacetylase (regulator of RNase III)